MFDVSGDDGEVMDKGGGGYEQVRQVTAGEEGELSGGLGDFRSDGDDPFFEGGPEGEVEPILNGCGEIGVFGVDAMNAVLDFEFTDG